MPVCSPAAPGRLVLDLVVPHPQHVGADQFAGHAADLRLVQVSAESVIGLPGVYDLDHDVPIRFQFLAGYVPNRLGLSPRCARDNRHQAIPQRVGLIIAVYTAHVEETNLPECVDLRLGQGHPAAPGYSDHCRSAGTL